MPAWLENVQQIAHHIPLRGTVPEVLIVVVMLTAFVALLLLVFRRKNLRRPARLAVFIIAPAVAFSLASWIVTTWIWKPLPDYVGLEIFGPMAVGVASLFALVAVLFSKQLKRIVIAIFASLIAVASSYAVPNIHYGTYATVADYLHGTGDVPDFDTVTGIAHVKDVFHPHSVASLERQWKPKESVPERGFMVKADIPASDFAPRTSFIYLPPAYFTQPRPLLPVLVLMAGQPGTPEDWLSSGNLQHTMDNFARDHQGLAPVVVSVDQLSSSLKNPLCSDTDSGAVATYLEKDVPNWINANLQVDSRAQSWAVGGLSNGGTCAMQALARQDGPYRTVLDMSGELHPDLGGLEKTIDEGFGGSKEKFSANDPLSIFESGADFTGYSAFCSIGSDEQQTMIDHLWKVCDAAKERGMDVETRTYPGDHEWKVWQRALADELPWLAGKFNLISDGAPTQ